MSKIRATRIQNQSALKASLKRGSGSNYLFRLPGDSTTLVRFLTEPYGDDAWIDYYEHYDSTRKYYPCVEGDCPGCQDGERASKRYLAAVVDVAENRVVPLVMPVTMAISVEKKYEKYGTLLDRDYELERSGTGFETTYEVTPEPPSKMNLSRYDVPDLLALLEDQLTLSESITDEDDDDDDDDDEDDDDVLAKHQKVAARKAAAADEDDEDDEETVALTTEALEGKSLRELKAIAASQGYGAAKTKGLDTDSLIELLTGGGDEITRESLDEMSLRELKTLAQEHDLKTAGQSRSDIIDMILSRTEEPPF